MVPDAALASRREAVGKIAMVGSALVTTIFAAAPRAHASTFGGDIGAGSRLISRVVGSIQPETGLVSFRHCWKVLFGVRAKNPSFAIQGRVETSLHLSAKRPLRWASVGRDLAGRTGIRR